jgi:hypothetical protein
LHRYLYFLALAGKYLEPATSSHPIEAEGYEIHPNFISLVRELNFAGGLDENSYKHLQDFEICDTLMISGMNHDTLVEGLSVLVNGMGKAMVQDPCQQLSWQFSYLKRSVLFCLLTVIQDY